MADTTKDAIERAIAQANLNWSHTSDGDGDQVIVWYDEHRDDPDAIVQAVERRSNATYVGEKQYPHDDVTGLVFEPDGPAPFPVDVKAAADAVIEACKDAQDGAEVVVPVTAIDEAEMPARLPETTPQETWDACRKAIRDEVESRGYRVD